MRVGANLVPELDGGEIVRRAFGSAIGASTLVAAHPAPAHHAMGGEMPTTLAQGLISGLAHPVIGPDHLAFVVGVGILSAFVPRGWILPAMFLVAGAFGTALHLGGFGIPAAETLVAISVLLMAAAIWFRGRKPIALFAALCGLGGLVHGYALAESIIGSEPTPFLAYLLGLLAVQLAISLLVRQAVLWIASERPTLARPTALAASMAMLVVGAALLPLWGS